MQMRMRVLVERHRDQTYTLSVLGMPPWEGEASELPERWLEELLGAPTDGPVAFPPASSLCAFGESVDSIRRWLADEVASRMAGAPSIALARYLFHPDQTLLRVAVPLTPIDGTGKDLDPVDVGFDVVLTRHPRPPHAIAVPRLGLVLALEDPAKAEDAARAEIAAFLKRRPGLRRVDQLWLLEPSPEARLDELAFETLVQTPLDEVRSDRRKDDREREQAKADASVLETVATSLSKAGAQGKLARGHEVAALADELLAFVGGDQERAIVLVGPSGVGKTAAIHEAVRRLGELPAARRRPVWHLTGTRIVAGMSGYGEWQERCRAIVAACRRTRAVASIGDPHELVEEGRAVGFDVSIADYLKRPIEKGELRVIGECTEQAWDALCRRDRGFAGLFRVIRVDEPDRARALSILGAIAKDLGRRHRGRFDAGALETTYELHARFAPYAAFPGKAIRFVRRLAAPVEMRSLAAKHRAAREKAKAKDPSAVGRAFDRQAVTQAFAEATGLPVAVLDDAVALDPDAVRDYMSRRVIAQPRATDLCVDLIARVKAGVADPRRPLGSFLFLGPTGVGKTETAKVLAQYLFGSRDRLVRLDMTEYQDRWAAARLTGGAGFEAEGDLTRRVRAEPMSVVLLDEIEKADSGVFDLLLQVMGDARLTDARGRVTDFRSAIVILTSNLGADLPEGSAGFGGAGADSADDGGARFLRAAEEFFRPELINRLDAVVPFAPLPRPAIDRIAKRELEAALSRDGLVRRGTAVSVAPGLLARVVEAGFHPRFGARPLKRAIERHVVAPLARHLAERSTRGGSARRIEVALENGAPRITVLEGPPAARDEQARTAAATDDVPARLRVQELLRRLSAQRRRIATLLRQDEMDELRDELRTLADMELRLAAGKPVDWDPRTDAARLARLRRVMGELERAHETACDLEDLGVVGFLDGDAAAVAAMADDVAALDRRIGEATFALRASRFELADAALVLIAPLERGAPLVDALTDVYERFGAERGLRVAVFVEGRDASTAGGPWPVFRRRGAPRAEQGKTGARALLVRGELAAPLLWAEAGRHRHLPGGKATGDRFALVGVLPLDKRDAEALAGIDGHTSVPPPPPATPPPEGEPFVPPEPGPFQRLHTIAVPGEKDARGVPSQLPLVVRIYDERSATPTIRDPRTALVIDRAGIDDAFESVARFAVALLAGEAGAP